jgi:hypothetical protein
MQVAPTGHVQGVPSSLVPQVVALGSKTQKPQPLSCV